MLATAGTRVRREGSFFSSEGSAHCIRRGHFSGRGSLQLLGKVTMAMGTDPHFPPMYGGFAALRAAVSGSWQWAGKQRRDGKRLLLVAMTPRQRHRGHRGRASARPSANERLLLTKIFQSRVAAFNGRSRSSKACERCWARAHAGCERAAAQYTYWRRLWDVSTPTYRVYLSSCISWP